MELEGENQVWYLLLHYGTPILSSGKDVKRHFRRVQKACRPVGITIVPFDVTHNNRQSQIPRYLFRFPRYQRDDAKALLFAESFIFSFAVVAAPMVDSNQDGFVLPIPRSMVGSKTSLPFQDLLRLEESRPPDTLSLDHPLAAISMVASATPERFEAAWRLVPLLMSRPDLSDAARFWKASQDEFFIFPGEIQDVLGAFDSVPSTQVDQTRFESALHNAFKAIEALIGDPPQDDQKFFARIRSIGLDPHEQVGYETKEELHTAIRNMNKARDKKSAHGSTRDRTITLGEMFNHHSCAKYVVFHAVQAALGEPLFH
jgi:hypothetical protein